MNFKAGVTLLFLCGLVIFHIEDCNACDLIATVGDSLNIPLKFMSLSQNDEIKWTHDNKLIFKRAKTKIIKGNRESVNEKGDFIIQSAEETHAGTYIFQVYNSDGTSKASGTVTLCVHEMLPKPVVNITCDKGKVVVKCDVQNTKDQIFIWYHNGVKTSENEQIYIRDVKNNDKLECEVEKPIKSHRSDAVPVLVKCTSESTLANKTLFGFDFRIMVGILATGGFLVLVLMIVLVTCACQSCKRQAKRLADEDELRLNFHTPPKRSTHTARGQPAPPVPQEDPEVSNYEVDDPPPKAQSRAKNQQRIRPPPPSVDDDESPPPLPQPRKKAPNTKKNQGPLYMQP
ncbi:hypothetical protein AOLI_G00241170 [Acnodon oligacanthus]